MRCCDKIAKSERLKNALEGLEILVVNKPPIWYRSIHSCCE